MNPQTLYRLSDRGIVALAGADRTHFLQGLLSNDVTLAGDGRAIFAGLLTAQGKLLYDLIVASSGGKILLEVEFARRGELIQLLKRYRLRADVSIHDLTDSLDLWASPAELPEEIKQSCASEGGVVFADPRLADLGWHLMFPKVQEARLSGCERGDPGDYQALRLRRGVAQSSQELAIGKDNLLEANFDKLNGISWNKGCYVGQEVTARLRYRGRVKRRLFPVTCLQECPPSGSAICQNGRVVGELRGRARENAIALLRLEASAPQGELPLTAAGVPVTVGRPAWLSC